MNIKFRTINKNIFFKVVFILAWSIPLLFYLRKIQQGSFAFWYDPARDLLFSLANLTSPSLIGPTTGIPGIFYGPYWNWSLSIPLFFTLDPRYVVIFVGIIPYFIIFPLVLYKFRTILDKWSILCMWLLFILGYKHYSTDLWNIYPAPLFFLIIVLFIHKIDLTVFTKKSIIYSYFAGFFSGLLLNFHISFGITTMIGIYIFTFILQYLQNNTSKKNKIIASLKRISILACGTITAGIPFILFEIRHNFLQVSSILRTFDQAIFHNSPVVGQKGLTDLEIIGNFIETFSYTLGIPSLLGIFLFFALLFIISRNFLQKNTHENDIRRLALLLVCISSSILVFYIMSKNPVWEYHFIGIEMIMLFIIGIAIKTNTYVKNCIIVIVLILSLYRIGILLLEFNENSTRIPHTLAAIESNAESIYKNAGSHNFSYAAYSPSIHTYDYDYIFKWKSPANLVEKKDAEYVYLIISKGEKDKLLEFQREQTPDTGYETIQRIELTDGTIVVKRQRKTTEQLDR